MARPLSSCGIDSSGTGFRFSTGCAGRFSWLGDLALSKVPRLTSRLSAKELFAFSAGAPDTSVSSGRCVAFDGKLRAQVTCITLGTLEGLGCRPFVDMFDRRDSGTAAIA